jgi:hypothetical protein
MKRWSLGIVALGAAFLAVTGVRGGADDKDKAKAKPPARSYSDDDLKKYKEKPKEEPATAATGESPEPTPVRERTTSGLPRRGAEYGEPAPLEPDPPPATSGVPTQEVVPEPPAPAEAKSEEEGEWRRRATDARRPVTEVQSRIAATESEMAVLKDQLNPMSATYVLGGNSLAGPGAVYEIEEKLRTLESRRVDAKAELVEAEKGWKSFLEEARSAGANPNWFTP